MSPRQMVAFLRAEAQEWRKMAESVAAERSTQFTPNEVQLAIEKAKQFDLIADYCAGYARESA